MKKLIFCPKERGNTYKACAYIAAHSGAEARVVDGTEKADLSKYDAVILASGVYGGHVHKNILNLIRGGGLDSMRPDAKIYVLLTWLGRTGSDREAFNEIKQALAEKGRKPEEDFIRCLGGMGPIKASHPDGEDLNKVLEWVMKTK